MSNELLASVTENGVVYAAAPRPIGSREGFDPAFYRYFKDVVSAIATRPLQAPR